MTDSKRRTRAVREALRWDSPATLAAMAKRLGCSPIHLTYIKSGSRPVSERLAKMMAKVLKEMGRTCERGAGRIAQALQPEAPDVHA
jgi:hypothetical protein